jgi:hypothetical protein
MVMQQPSSAVPLFQTFIFLEQTMATINKHDKTYNAAVEMVKAIEDEAYRDAAIDAVIEVRVLRELGYKHPSGELAMKLRRQAKS